MHQYSSITCLKKTIDKIQKLGLLTMYIALKLQLLYRVSENEGQPEKGYKTLKIGGLDHLFGISVIYT